MRSKTIVPLLVFLLSFFLYFLSTEHLIATVHWPTGDEPYYLLIAHSLVHDGDFELTNNFKNEDYLRYYPGLLYPRHEAVTPKPILVSKHSLGVPLLIAPAYALGDWHGAAHTMNLFGALLAVNIFLLARETSGSTRAALIVWLALAFATPFFTYAELIFPEAPAAWLIVYAWRHLRAWHNANHLQRFFVALCLAYLPWLHARFLFIVAGLALYQLANIWTTNHRVTENTEKIQKNLRALCVSVVSFLPSMLSAALFIAYNLYVYDSILPNYADHSGSGHPAEIFAAFFGIFLDQQWGWLNHAPIYVLALAALVYFRFQISDFRLKENSAVLNLQSAISNLKLKWLALITLPYFILIVQYRFWWGEWCPPARYLTPILPLLVGPLALAVTHIHTARFKTIFIVLTVWGWGVALMFAANGKLMYNHPLGKSALLVALSDWLPIDLTRFEPSFIMMFLNDFDVPLWIATQTVLTIAWLVGLLGVAALALGWSWSPRNTLTPTRNFPIIRATSTPEE
jgi:thiol-disulfide isomerase/thioredoxin